MGQQIVSVSLVAAAERIHRAAEIDGAPQGDGSRDPRQAAGPLLLELGGAITQAAEAVEADGAAQRVAALALVQLGRSPCTQGRSNRLIGREVRPSKNTVAEIVKRNRS